MFYTVEEAAEVLKVNPQFIYQHIKEIPHSRIGKGRGAIRFTMDNLVEYMKLTKVNVGSEYTECSMCGKLERTGTEQDQPYICSECTEAMQAEDREWEKADVLHEIRRDK